jgi:Phosphodiester glycosidase
MKKTLRWSFVIGLMIGIPLVSYLLFTMGRPAALPVKREVFQGVTYHRIVRYLPHAMIAHVLVIDTKNTVGLHFIVTPPDELEGGVLKARTTSQFLQEFGVQIAINGDGFFPWWSRSPLDYYPHVGDPVTPNGYSASQGDVYADGLQDVGPEPTLYISRRNDLAFNDPPNRIFHALSGDLMLIMGGKLIPNLNDSILHPRTGIGLNQNGRWLYLVVIDGRQPFYSMGATYKQLADLLLGLGAEYAMALDGGGSSTMVIQGENGEPEILNSPIDSYIPGRERPVANHFGVYIDR